MKRLKNLILFWKPSKNKKSIEREQHFNNEILKLKKEIELINIEISSLQTVLKEIQGSILILTAANQTLSDELSYFQEILKSLMEPTSKSRYFEFNFRNTEDDLPN